MKRPGRLVLGQLLQAIIDMVETRSLSIEASV